ncbi:MAG: phosphatidylglycerophosphatase A [Deltaproteobacteria bacterium]|nr:phosphatidylglycerophosphatase A [Deltaproteobacteria bacterium]
MWQGEEYRDRLIYQRILDRGATLVATGGFAGYAAVIPGTVGSLVGLLLYLPLAALPAVVPSSAIVILFFLGVLASSRVEKIWGIKDPKPVVIDEIVGMWISLLFAQQNVTYFLGAFVLFRVFDVFKPFPARRAELLKGGWGIMFDDVVAGLYANAAIHGIWSVRHFLGQSQ